MSGLAFLDLETTGLDPGRHDIWEIGYLLRGGTGQERDEEHRYLIAPNLEVADPMGLTISRFYARTLARKWDDPEDVARQLAVDLDGRHIVGAVPSFDAAFLAPFLRKHGQCPTWHYHLIDVEALAVGFLSGVSGLTTPRIQPPWRSDDLSRAVGVEPPTDNECHTALGDARWARDLYDAITDGGLSA